MCEKEEIASAALSKELQEEEEKEATTAGSRLDAIHDCSRWIASMDDDDDDASSSNGSNCPYGVSGKEGDMVEFRYSKLSNNVGLFAKKDISKGEVLIRLPQVAILRESHALVQSSPTIIALIDQVMNAHDAFVTERSTTINSRDLFNRRNQGGRVLGPVDTRMIVLVTILLYAAESSFQDDSSSNIRGGDDGGDDGSERFSSMDKYLSTDIVKLALYWSPFFNTWTESFHSLPMFWNDADLDTIRGTCHHAYVSRVRQDVKDSWNLVIQPALKQAGFVIPNQPDDCDILDLPFFYKRAVGATYSRSHGASKPADSLMSMFESILGTGNRQQQQQQHWLCPLLDCVNGARDDNDINVEMSNDDHAMAPIELKSLRNLKSGEELIIDYADMPNRDYFAKFGFVPLKRGQPVLHQLDMVALHTPRELIPDDSDLRWRKLHKFGFAAERLKEESYFAQTFALIANDDDMSYYRRLPETAEWLEGNPCAQIGNLINFAFSVLANEKELLGIEQEPYLAPWQAGAVVIKIVDHALDQLATPSNEYDTKLLKSTTQTSNQRIGTYARMLDRELLLKWRHAICERNYLYEYDEAEVEYVPALDRPSLSCFTCKSSFRLKKCTQCQETYYCSVQCQKEDRRRHKKFCQEMSAIREISKC